MGLRRQKWLLYFLPILFLILGISFTYFSQNVFEETANKLVSIKTHFIETQIADNLEQLLLNRALILEFSAETHSNVFPKDNKTYENIARSIYNNVSGFLAINWIDPGGYIRWVYPDDSINEKAKNKKVIDRADVGNYLQASRDMHKPQLSQIVDLYQGTRGFILYVPIYGQDGQFRGWFNGVVKYKQLLDRFFSNDKFEDFYIKVTWLGNKNSIYEYGPPHKLQPEFASQFKILNQTLLVEANLRSDALIIKSSHALTIIFLFSYLVIFIIAALFYKLLHTHLKFTETYEELNRDKIIISVLSHDMATPLTLIAENALRLKEKIKTSYAELDRIVTAAEKQKDLLQKVRSLHATRLGKLKIELIPCHIVELVKEALCEFDEKFKSKKISYKIDIPENLSPCLADKTTAVNNVLGNVLSNAIKFSNENTTVTLRAFEEGSYIVLEIKNQGRGIRKDMLKNIFEVSAPTTLPGTHGEGGTGLGLLQIKVFMDYYGGKIQIHSNDSGTQVQLYFIKA